MAPVLNALSNEGVHPMLLKGWALPDGYGGRGWLRARFDLDLLVPEERFSSAARLFEEHGFPGPSTSSTGISESATVMQLAFPGLGA
jgi:hypothetical protein